MHSRLSNLRLLVLGGGLLLGAAMMTRAAIPVATTRVSLGLPSVAEPGGRQGDRESTGGVSLSPDGRFVAFVSNSTNFVSVPKSDMVRRIYLRDRVANSTELISIPSNQTFVLDPNRNSGAPSVSNDGRFIAFESLATNLVQGDGNLKSDVFLRDRRGPTIRASVTTAGAEGDGDSGAPSLSGDGRFVAYQSVATNLVAGDANGASDIFRTEFVGGPTRVFTTLRVSLSGAGGDANGASRAPSISADGRFVAFESDATNLVGNDNNMTTDVFVRDLGTGQTILLSKDDGGNPGDRASRSPAISAGGRFVVFTSRATNLVPDDTNGVSDVFLHDRDTDQDGIFDEDGNIRTTLVSRASDKTVGNADSGTSGPTVPLDGRAAVTPDGRFVIFPSQATNLVAGDTNAVQDIFIRDVRAGTTDRVNVGGGVQADKESSSPGISAKGDLAAFSSLAENLVAGDTNRASDVFAVTIAGGSSGNEPPRANAGPDAQAFENQNVQLDASRSSDLEDNFDALEFTWTQVGGPPVTLNDPQSVNPTFAAPQVVHPIPVIFQLTVEDTTGQTGTDQVIIQIATAPPGTLAGRVVNGAGAGVAGARIQAMRDDGATQDPVFSDATGNYFLPGVRVGDNTAICRAPGFETVAEDFTATSGGASALNFVLDVVTARLLGRIQLADGGGLANALVELVDLNGAVIAAGKTDGAGNYVLVDLDKDEVTAASGLRATRVGFITLTAVNLGLEPGRDNVRDFRYGNLRVQIKSRARRAARFVRDTEVRIEIGNEVVARNVVGRGRELRFPNIPPGNVRVRGVNPNLRAGLTEIVLRGGPEFVRVQVVLEDPARF